MACAQETEPAPAAEARPAAIPAETFAATSNFAQPRLSPDGGRIAFRNVEKGKTNVGFSVVGSDKILRLPIPDTYELEWFRWAGNERALVAISAKVQWLGEEQRRTQLVVLEPATGHVRFIGSRAQGLEGDDVLYVDPAGEYILLSSQKSIYDYPSVSRITLADNNAKTVMGQRDGIWEWYADNHGAVRMGTGRVGGRLLVYYRKSGDDQMKLVGRIKDGDDDAFLDVSRIVAESDDGYTFSNDETGRYAFYRYNYATRQVGEKLYGNDRYDLDEAEFDDAGKLRAIYYTDDRDRVEWFDPAMKIQQTKLERALPGKHVWVLSRSRDDKRMIVWAGAPDDPGGYFLYEPAARTMQRFAEAAGPIDPAVLAATTPVKYKARDGLEITAYLTVPRERDPKSLPLILMPHGGPFGVRDKLEYDAQVQWLAHQGYAVLQPNYRGSGGYGKELSDKGLGQIGRAMQDDLDDGMDWLVAQGIADKSRVCLVGASYGGYAALWGVIRNPERYRCAASFAGVTDWKPQLKYDRRFFWTGSRAKAWNAKVQGEEEFDLDNMSPVKQAARLTRPVLLAHGEEDSNVPFSQYKAFVAATQKAGKPIETRTYKTEGHGFNDAANRADWFTRLGAFLKKHNPAD